MYICISSSFAVVVEIDFIHKKKTESGSNSRIHITTITYDITE